MCEFNSLILIYQPQEWEWGDAKEKTCSEGDAVVGSSSTRFSE